MHKRLAPKVHAFRYGMYYLAVPLGGLDQLPMRRNKFGVFSFYDRDHGKRDGTRLDTWIKDLLAAEKIPEANGSITLVTLPRILGYVFNPVSFWLCFDQEGGLRAVLCEVNNTFGEHHNYICRHSDRRVIKREDWLTGEKAFHVSPFLPVEGTYRFRFHCDGRIFGAFIDHHDAEGKQKLLTSLTGHLTDLTASSLRLVFWRYPLVTLKAVTLIHWQAVRLLVKGARYIRKPLQREEKLTSAENITKM